MDLDENMEAAKHNFLLKVIIKQKAKGCRTESKR